MANPVFRVILRDAKNTRPEDYIPLEQLDRELGPLTEVDRAFGNTYGDALDRLAEEQDGEVTDEQGRLLQLVLLADAHVRGEKPLAQLAADSGVPEESIRAVAVSLRAVGLRAAHVVGPA